MKHWKARLKSSSVPFLMILIIIGIMAGIGHSMKNFLSDSIHQTLNEITEQQASCFYRKIDADISVLKTAALLLDSRDKSDLNSLMPALAANADFSTLAVVDAQGEGIDAGGRRIDFSNSAVYRDAMAGETAVGVEKGSITEEGEALLVLAVPLHGGQQAPQGALIGGYSKSVLNTLIRPSFDGAGRSYLVSGEGDVLFSGETAAAEDGAELPVLDAQSPVSPIAGSERSQILSDMARGQTGHSVFEQDGVQMHCHYDPVGINGWYVFTVLPSGVGTAYVSAVSAKLAAAAVVIIAIFALCGAYIVIQQRKYTAALERAAFHDELCNCPNLTRFKMNAQRFIDGRPDNETVLVKFDIKGFKLLNRILGKAVCDRLLVVIADTLRQLVPGECFCRAYNDEYYALFAYGTPWELSVVYKDFLNRIYEGMGSGFSHPIQIVAGHYFMSFEHCRSVTEAMERANVAHHKAKELGVEFCAYDEEFVRQALWKERVESRIDEAIANGEIQVYLQAQYTVSSETVSSAEALARWNSKEDGLLPPSEFIPILEESGQITKLDFFVLEKVCRTLREWMDEGKPPIEISVNFSRKHLANPNFVEDCCRIVDRYGIPHQMLALELTESAFWENEKILLRVATQLQELGFLLSVDDFGSGYSSLSLLKNLPVDILKIDRSFFTDNYYKNRANNLIYGVMKMAKQLQMTSIAEGVELQEHIDLLREAGCDKVQSFYYERPTPIEGFWERERFTAPPQRAL